MRTSYFIISVSLLVCLFIYLFYRTDQTVVNQLVIRVLSDENYKAMRESVRSQLHLNDWMIFSLPEGLWIYCATLVSKRYYLQFGSFRLRCVFIPVFYAVALEILQLLQIMNGRFDFMDIAASTAFFLFGIFTFRKASGEQNLFNRMTTSSLACFAIYSSVYLSHVTN